MTDINTLIDDSTIKTELHGHAPTTPSGEDLTVNNIRDALSWAQTSLEEVWAEWMDNIEHNETEVVHEDDDVIVFSTGEYDILRTDLQDVYEEAGDRGASVVNALHHQLAREYTDYDWGHEYPYVYVKTDSFDVGQRYVEAVMNGLMKRGVSPGQAWAYYGVQIRGNSRNSWATRCGYSDHSAVSEAVRKAERKL